LQVEKINYNDNTEIIDLIERVPHGFVSTLEDEMKLPSPNDDWLMKTLDANFKKSTKYKRELKNNHEFTLKHFAKDVKYNIDGFIFKN